MSARRTHREERDIKSMARLIAALWDDKKAEEWVGITDRNDVYGVVLLLKEQGLDIASSALDDVLGHAEVKKD